MPHYTEKDDIRKYWDDRYVEWDKHPDEAALRGKDAWFEERFTHLLGAPRASLDGVLDFGCGNGMYSEALLRRYGWYAGVDVSAKALHIARRYFPESIRRVYRLLGAGPTNIPWPDETFDCVVSITVLQHLPVSMRLAAIAELKRVLRPGGVYVGLEMMGNTQAFDMPPMPEGEWLEAWLPLRVTRDIPAAHPEWAADNVWFSE